MVLNRFLCSVVILVSVSQIACHRTLSPPSMAMANEALQEYCKTENIAFDNFNKANVYREKDYDWCVEFITKTNSAPKHVLLLFFKGQQIVERQKIIEPVL